MFSCTINCLQLGSAVDFLGLCKSLYFQHFSFFDYKNSIYLTSVSIVIIAAYKSTILYTQCANSVKKHRKNLYTFK